MRPIGEEMTPDVLLVPLLAFDLGGRRLGYGGGFYDRTLAGLPGRVRVWAVPSPHRRWTPFPLVPTTWHWMRSRPNAASSGSGG